MRIGDNQNTVKMLADAAYADVQSTLSDAIETLIELRNASVDMVDNGNVSSVSDPSKMLSEAKRLSELADRYSSLCERAVNSTREYKKYSSVL